MQPKWARTLRVGDLLTTAHGKPRVVREVTHRPNGDLHAVTFSIQHCSWTNRCFTTYIWHDLKCAGYAKVRGHVRLRTRLDQAITAAIEQIHTHPMAPKVLTCCDVKGVR